MTARARGRAGAGTPGSGFSGEGGKPAERPTGQSLTNEGGASQSADPPHVAQARGLLSAAHPLAERFPLVREEELRAIAIDMREHGMQRPVVLDGEGRLVDGRNRLAAVVLTGHEPKGGIRTETRAFASDAEVAAFVISANIERRHLTETQRALIAADLAPQRVRGRPSKTRPQTGLEGLPDRQLAARLGVSESSISRARTVAAVPAQRERVERGQTTLRQAAEEVRAGARRKRQGLPPAAPMAVPKHRPVLIEGDCTVEPSGREEIPPQDGITEEPEPAAPAGNPIMTLFLASSERERDEFVGWLRGWLRAGGQTLQ